MSKYLLLIILSGLVACGGGGSGSKNSTTGASATTSSEVKTSSSVSSAVSSSLPSSSSSAVPILVESTSYLNKLKFGDPNHGKSYAMSEENGKTTRPLAYGDFFQDGSTTALSTQIIDDNHKLPADQWKAGRLYFFKQEGTRWVDVTNKLLADTTGCISLKKASIADYNNDGKPDLFLGCNGADTAGSTGENLRVLLSQADGAYKNIALPTICYCHASASGDINGDGNVDVVVYDNLSINGRIPHAIALIGNGDGTFTEDTARFSKTMDSKPIFTLDLIDLGGGFLDLLIGGYGTPPNYVGCDCNFDNSIARNDGKGNFEKIEKIDNSLSPKGAWYDIAMDFVVKDGYLYFAQVGNQYYSAVVRKVPLNDLTQSTILTEYVHPFGVGSGPWFPWIVILDNGKVASMCDYSAVDKEWCNWTGI